MGLFLLVIFLFIYILLEEILELIFMSCSDYSDDGRVWMAFCQVEQVARHDFIAFFNYYVVDVRIAFFYF